MAVMDLPHTMTVERLVSSGAIKEAYTVRPGSIACFLQPVAPQEAGAVVGGQFTKGYRCFIDYDSNVKTKDRVTINGSKYNVSGLTEHQYGTWPHKVLSLEAI